MLNDNPTPVPLAMAGLLGYTTGMEDCMYIQAHEAWFARYAEDFCAKERARPDGDTGPLQLKIDHTARVLAHARVLAQGEAFSPVLRRACVLAALYHDVARFPQYYRWHTFKDSVSANHGLLGAQVLKREQRLREEGRDVRVLVLAAVAMHNRFAVPPGVPADVRTVTDVVRDADKLDIFRVMAGHLCGEKPYDKTVVLSVADDPDLWTPKVVDDCLQGRVASYADLRSINDFRLLLGTWVDDVRFAATQQALVASGLVPQLLEPLPPVPEVQAARQAILRRLERLCPSSTAPQGMAQGVATNAAADAARSTRG